MSRPNVRNRLNLLLNCHYRNVPFHDGARLPATHLRFGRFDRELTLGISTPNWSTSLARLDVVADKEQEAQRYISEMAWHCDDVIDRNGCWIQVFIEKPIT
jgi:hypothetical protein